MNSISKLAPVSRVPYIDLRKVPITVDGSPCPPESIQKGTSECRCSRAANALKCALLLSNGLTFRFLPMLDKRRLIGNEKIVRIAVYRWHAGEEVGGVASDLRNAILLQPLDLPCTQVCCAFLAQLQCLCSCLTTV